MSSSNNKMTLTEIGKLVRRVRESTYDAYGQQLTQTTAADLCGLKLRQYQSVERGEVNDEVLPLAGLRSYQKVSIGLDIPFTISFPIKK